MAQQKANRFGPAVSSRTDPKKAQQAREESARRTKTVRVTVDLDPPTYSAMRRVLLDVADAADHPTLTAAAMWRALLAEASEDPELLKRVAARIAAGTEPS